MANNIRVHDVCKTKLFAIVRERRFYCRKCNLIITTLDGNGNRVGPGNNPRMTEEEIRAIQKNTIPVEKKVVYKLVSRPIRGGR